MEDYLLFVWKFHWVSLTLFLPERWRRLLHHHVHFLPLSPLSGDCFCLFILESPIVITMSLHRNACRDFQNLSLHFRILTQLTKAEAFYHLYATVALWHPTILVSLLRRLACLLHLFLKTFGFLIGSFCTRVTLSKYILYLFNLSKRNGTISFVNSVHSNLQNISWLWALLSLPCTIFPGEQHSSPMSFLFSCSLTRSLYAPQSSQRHVKNNPDHATSLSSVLQ